MSVKVKICGITSLSDGLAAIGAGADALGFMFFEQSSRCVSPEVAARIIRQLPPFVARVGVFVDASKDYILQTARTCGLDTIQLHGEESPEFCSKLDYPVIKGFRMRDAESLKSLPAYGPFTWLLDSYVAGQKGGTGSGFNWELAIQAARLGNRIILAGGLNPENVAEAVRQVRPYGVDVSSGVELSPGKKDPARLNSFIKAAKGA